MRCLALSVAVAGVMASTARAAAPPEQDDKTACDLTNIAALLEVLLPDLRVEFDDDDLDRLDADLIFSWPIHYPTYFFRSHLLVSPFLEVQTTTSIDLRALGGVRATLLPSSEDDRSGLFVEMGGVGGEDGNGFFVGLGLSFNIGLSSDAEEGVWSKTTLSWAVARHAFILEGGGGRSDVVLLDTVIPFRRCPSP